MSGYKVTIKVTETYTFDADGMFTTEDAIKEAFQYRELWLLKRDSEEFNVTAEVVGHELELA